MSEHQYFEFAAIDHPLTRDEMAQLRAVSTRAEITPSGFINHYQWGSLKADPADWMRRYFDAFVHIADWGSCHLALRVPLETFHEEELKPFARRHALSLDRSDEHWIIHWLQYNCEDYERFSTEDGSGWMQRLAPLREDLSRGDLRPLYLGWLASTRELDDDVLEPEVPPGLADLSRPQRALVEFIEVDPDLLAAAATGSRPSADRDDAAQASGMDAWLDGWPREEMAAVLKLIAQDRGREAERQVKSRHAAWLKAQRPASSASAPRRSLGQLRQLAQSAREVRLAHEARQRAAREAERRQQREAELRRLMADVDTRWASIDALAQRGSSSSYDQAARELADLAEGYALTSSRQNFDRALQRLLVRHANRSALLRRLAKAGLQPG